MKKATKYGIPAAGIILLVLGLYLLKAIKNPNQFLTTLPYVCIGLGSGLFGHGAGNLLAEKAVRRNPGLQKQMEIEQNDERNVLIASRAKARAFDSMTFLFGALMVTFALMGVEVVPILLLVFAYLFVHGCAIYYRCRYSREM